MTLSLHNKNEELREEDVRLKCISPTNSLTCSTLLPSVWHKIKWYLHEPHMCVLLQQMVFQLEMGGEHKVK